MLLNYLLWLNAALAQAEIGLVVRSRNSMVDGKPIRLLDGQLSVDNGPILQGYFDQNEKIIVSSRLISRNITGAGIGLTTTGQLIISENPSAGFLSSGGWLEHVKSDLFYAQPTDEGWMIYANLSLDTPNIPIMLQIADIEYEDTHASSATTIPRSVTATAARPRQNTSTHELYYGEHVNDDEIASSAGGALGDDEAALDIYEDGDYDDYFEDTSTNMGNTIESKHSIPDIEMLKSSGNVTTDSKSTTPNRAPLSVPTTFTEPVLGSVISSRNSASDSPTIASLATSTLSKWYRTTFATATAVLTVWAPVPTVTQTVYIPH